VRREHSGLVCGPSRAEPSFTAVPGRRQRRTCHVAFATGCVRAFQRNSFDRGGRSILDYHYFNTSSAEVEAHVAVNFHFVPESGVKKLAHGFSAMNLTIAIPRLGKAAFTGECRFSQDLLVGGIVRHTHR
jgi:hypothetical protein